MCILIPHIKKRTLQKNVVLLRMAVEYLWAHATHMCVKGAAHPLDEYS